MLQLLHSELCHMSQDCTHDAPTATQWPLPHVSRLHTWCSNCDRVTSVTWLETAQATDADLCHMSQNCTSYWCWPLPHVSRLHKLSMLTGFLHIPTSSVNFGGNCPLLIIFCIHFTGQGGKALSDDELSHQELMTSYVGLNNFNTNLHKFYPAGDYNIQRFMTLVEREWTNLL